MLSFFQYAKDDVTLHITSLEDGKHYWILTILKVKWLQLSPKHQKQYLHTSTLISKAKKDYLLSTPRSLWSLNRGTLTSMFSTICITIIKLLSHKKAINASRKVASSWTLHKRSKKVLGTSREDIIHHLTTIASQSRPTVSTTGQNRMKDIGKITFSH